MFKRCKCSNCISFMVKIILLAVFFIYFCSASWSCFGVCTTHEFIMYEYSISVKGTWCMSVNIFYFQNLKCQQYYKLTVNDSPYRTVDLNKLLHLLLFLQTRISCKFSARILASQWFSKPGSLPPPPLHPFEQGLYYPEGSCLDRLFGQYYMVSWSMTAQL